MIPKAPEVRARAEARFRIRDQQAADAPKAVQDYRAAQEAIRERTRKLREERLAREAKAQATNQAAKR